MKRDLTLSVDLKISSEPIGTDAWVLRPQGSIDSSTTEAFKNRLSELLSGHPDSPHVLLDMSGVKYISSMGLGTLIGLFKKTKDRGSSFGLYNPQLAVQRVLEISRLDFLIVRPGSTDDPSTPFTDYVRRAESQRVRTPQNS